MSRKPAQVPRLSERPDAAPRLGAPEAAALGFGLIWLCGVGLYLWSGPGPSGLPGLAMTALLVVLPLGLAWFTLSSLRAVRSLRAEAARLQQALDGMRVAHASSQQQSQTASTQRSPEPGREKAASASGGEAALHFASRRDGTLTVPSADRKTALQLARPSAAGEDQPALALGTPMDEADTVLAIADFLRAIHFPENPEDGEGFRALRVALADRTTAKLIRASQDVLTLLAQDGIYMDDLAADRARPELWRKFAAGQRGRPIAGLGGVRDRSCLALTAARMREDAVFRDAAHHFLRSFDKAIVAIEPRASDAELSDLSDTRTARAFMLFGRVTGTFD